MNHLMRIVLIIFISGFFANHALAYFVGPAVIIQGQWGSGDENFSAGTEDDPAFVILRVDETDSLIIGDGGNLRVKIYGSSGVWKKNFSYKNISPLGSWPDNLQVKAGVGIFSFYEKLQKYDYEGNLLWSALSGAGNYWVANDGGIWLEKDQKSYFKYSSAGQLEKTYTSRPLELGLIEIKKLKDGQFQFRAQYPDRVYTVTTPVQMPIQVVRDSFNNLFIAQRIVNVIQNDGLEEFKRHYSVYRYNACGKETGKIDLPEDISQVIGQDTTVGVIRQSLAAYDVPVISSKGNIYSSKSTPSDYSVLKWTWVDDPNVTSGPDAPTSLTVAASIDGIYLSWKASPQDPGCVTSYEIYRATSAGGVVSMIGTVIAGQLKYNDTTGTAGTMYYYKIRAMSGSDPSVYTSEVSGKR